MQVTQGDTILKEFVQLLLTTVIDPKLVTQQKGYFSSLRPSECLDEFDKAQLSRTEYKYAHTFLQYVLLFKKYNIL
jgi:hypothetical protein